MEASKWSLGSSGSGGWRRAFSALAVDDAALVQRSYAEFIQRAQKAKGFGSIAPLWDSFEEIDESCEPGSGRRFCVAALPSRAGLAYGVIQQFDLRREALDDHPFLPCPIA